MLERTAGVSYRAYRPSSKSATMMGKGNRRADTKPELLLRRALAALGLRYRLHPRTIVGSPDIAFRSTMVAVFCDGDFWHGRDWQARKRRLARGANAAYWTAKISRNIDRDREITLRLRKDGWLVIRIWEGDIRKDPERIALFVLNSIVARSR